MPLPGLLWQPVAPRPPALRDAFIRTRTLGGGALQRAGSGAEIAILPGNSRVASVQPHPSHAPAAAWASHPPSPKFLQSCHAYSTSLGPGAALFPRPGDDTRQLPPPHGPARDSAWKRTLWDLHPQDPARPAPLRPSGSPGSQLLPRIPKVPLAQPLSSDALSFGLEPEKDLNQE